MSGRKQHYIPQFVLRNFASTGQGKKKQVKVYKPDGTFMSSTEGIGAEREFYSKLSDEEVTLDLVITDAETEYAEIYRAITASGADDKLNPNSVARLLCHLSVRGNNLRDSISVGGRYAIAKAMEAFSDSDTCKQMLGLAGSEPSRTLKTKLDGFYNENKPKIQAAGMSRHEFRKFAFKHAKDNWDESFSKSLPDMLLGYPVLDFPKLAAEAHNDILSKSLEPEARVAALEALPWTVVETTTPLILPDCIGIAHDSEEGPIPLAFGGGDGLKGVFFPVNPYKAVCGGVYLDDMVRNTLLENFHMFASACSWDFFIANPDTKIDPGIQRFIGNQISRTIVSAIQASLQEAVLDGFTT